MKLYPVYEALLWKHGEGKFIAGVDITTPAVTSWKSELPKPTSEELIALCEEYEEATSYIEARKKEYPSVEEQLDMIYQDIESWKTKIKEIKDKHPKPQPKVKAKKKAKKVVVEEIPVEGSGE